MAIPSSPQRD